LDDDILIVSAVNSSHQRATFTGGAANYGPCVDIFAPGQAVATIYSPGSANAYASSDGTSIAAPFVSGVIAALFQQKPTAANWEPQYILKGSATDSVLYQTTLGTGSPNKLLNSLHRWVWIAGPTVVSSALPTTATWSSEPLGGNGSWTYSWLASKDGGPWIQVSTNASYTRTITKFSEYELQLKVVATSLGESAPALAPMVITVTCGGC